MDFIKYGRQIGNVHSDGSVLRKGNSLFGQEGVRALLDKEGVVQKFICKNRKTQDTFEVVHATPINNNKYNVVKMYYCNDAQVPFIRENRYIGERIKKDDGTNIDWELASGNDMSTKLHFLKPRVK